MSDEVAYKFFDLSGFTAKSEEARLPDHMIIHAIEETPEFVKQGIEEECEKGKNLDDADMATHANCFVMNAILFLMAEMKRECGSADFMGVLNAYDMPPSYAHMINQLRMIDDERNETEKVMTADELDDIWEASE
tara:strand:- start:129 stop:533 length:405 start_codon:yes stop_codon:yes gene_type:complete